RPAGQRLLNRGLENALDPWPEVTSGIGDDLEVIEEDRAGKLRPIPNEESRLQSDEGHGAVRPHGVTERHAGVTVQARRYIHCQDRTTGAVDIADDLRDLLARGSAQPRAEQGIDDHFPLGQPLPRKGLDLS